MLTYDLNQCQISEVLLAVSGFACHVQIKAKGFCALHTCPTTKPHPQSLNSSILFIFSLVSTKHLLVSVKFRNSHSFCSGEDGCKSVISKDCLLMQIESLR